MCQSPSRRGTHFYHSPDRSRTSAMVCVNPLHVGELISTSDIVMYANQFVGCVNPLHVGELISTHILTLSRAGDNLCQSPSRRGTHFYQETGRLPKRHPIVCQSPSRRGTHFYMGCVCIYIIIEFCVNPLHVGELISTIKKEVFIWHLRCVNPLHVGELISTSLETIIIQIAILCQSPSRRGTHFYSVGWSHLRMADLCQSPSRRGTHFYPHPYFLLNLCGFPASISGVFSRQF